MLRKLRNKLKTGKKLFAVHMFDKGFLSTICKELLQLNSKKDKQSNLKLGKRFKHTSQKKIYKWQKCT